MEPTHDALEKAVASWEASVVWLVKGWDVPEEWDHDMYAREVLEELLDSFEGDIPQPLRDRIVAADEEFRAATLEITDPDFRPGGTRCGKEDPRLPVDRQKYWFRFRYPPDID